MAVERYYKRSVCSAGDSPCWSIRIHVQTLVQLLSEVVRAWVQCRLLCAVHLRGYRVQRSVGGLLVTAQLCGAASCINLRHSSISEEVCFSLCIVWNHLLVDFKEVYSLFIPVVYSDYVIALHQLC